jgi:hypothetical protein
MDLGRDYQWQELTIDMVCCESKMLNWYKSKGEDFADLTFQYSTGAGFVNVPIRVTQYCDLYGSGV